MTDISDGLVADLGHIADGQRGAHRPAGRPASTMPGQAARGRRRAQRRPDGLGADRRRRLRAGRDLPRGTTAARDLDGDRRRHRGRGRAGGRAALGRRAATSTSADRVASSVTADGNSHSAVWTVDGARATPTRDVAPLIAAGPGKRVRRSATAVRTSRSSTPAEFVAAGRPFPGRPPRRRAGARWAAGAGRTTSRRVEIKRMYVRSSNCGGAGWPGAILAELELRAAAAGDRRARSQHRARTARGGRAVRVSGRLHARSPGFGHYANMPRCALFFGKCDV